MATRSAIGYYTEDQKIRAVYCHWDGYPENNGRLLSKFYSDGWSVVENLVENGNMTALNETIDTTDYYTKRGLNLEVYTFEDEQEYISHMGNMGCEYLYLYLHDVDHDTESPHWFYTDSTRQNFVPLTLD